MAYAQEGLKMIAPGGAVGTGDGSVKNIYSYITNDTLATVLADAYFDGITGDPLNAGDMIQAVTDVDGTPVCADLLVTTGGTDVTVEVVNAAAGSVQTISTASSVANAYGTVALNGGAAMNIADPIPGVDVAIVRQSASTTATTLIPSSTGVTFDYAGNRKLTFDAQDEAVILRGVSATQFAIVSNVGSVAAAST